MVKKEYRNGDITVVWESDKCIHSAKCIRGLPDVFDTRKRPWITIEGADYDTIIKQVDTCPSKALTWYSNNQKEELMNDEKTNTKAEMLLDGPILLSGKITVKHSDGREELCDNPALCRCGGSAKKPFCDGTHNKIGFKG